MSTVDTQDDEFIPIEQRLWEVLCPPSTPLGARSTEKKTVDVDAARLDRALGILVEVRAMPKEEWDRTLARVKGRSTAVVNRAWRRLPPILEDDADYL